MVQEPPWQITVPPPAPAKPRGNHSSSPCAVADDARPTALTFPLTGKLGQAELGRAELSPAKRSVAEPNTSTIPSNPSHDQRILNFAPSVQRLSPELESFHTERQVQRQVGGSLKENTPPPFKPNTYSRQQARSESARLPHAARERVRFRNLQPSPGWFRFRTGWAARRDEDCTNPEALEYRASQFWSSTTWELPNSASHVSELRDSGAPKHDMQILELRNLTQTL